MILHYDVVVVRIEDDFRILRKFTGSHISSEAMDDMQSPRQVDAWLKENKYKQVADEEFNGQWHYRLIKPEWIFFHEWLRVEYNEKEQKTPVRSAEESAYQSIVGMLI